MFRLVQVTNIAGDGTCGYVVELDKEYTVREFIELFNFIEKDPFYCV